MTEAERYHFERLKERIAEVRADGGSIKPVAEWSGRDIRSFQEDLEAKVKGSISEKWFYTHMKRSDQEKLPRIDTLDLLSRYVGSESWEAFKAEAPYEKENGSGDGGITKKGARRTGPLILLGFLLIGIGSIPFWWNGERSYQLCFVNADTGERIRNERIELRLMKEGESALSLRCDSNGCAELSLRKERFRLIVNAPYYKTDTIVRKALQSKGSERIPLEADDQALLIGHYSQSAPKDLEKRRKRLDRILAEDARIFQVLGEEQRGVEMYNKQEFIDKLTMPLQSLQRIEILETDRNEEGRIRTIRFRQAPKSAASP